MADRRAGDLCRQIGVESEIVTWIGNLDVSDLGYIVIGLFVVTWAIAARLWHCTGVERRWQRDLAADQRTAVARITD
jgi:high-affinity nickel-transport protein